MALVGTLLDQSIKLPSPTLTEKNIASQEGKVFIVTGGYAGVGEQLSTILYGANGTVYVAGRSPEKGAKAIEGIKSAHPGSKGKIEFLKVDLADLSTIKPAVDEFTSKESRLDVLTNNAGVMFPPSGSKTAQGIELQIGTNCVGPYLFTELLKPILTSTAKSAEPGAVRVTWAGSLAVDLFSPSGGGLTYEPDEEGRPKVLNKYSNYGQSKAGNLLLSCEAKKRWGDESNVMHICFNPGNLKSELQRHSKGAFLMNPVLYPAIFGAYTELFCALSEKLTMADSGTFIKPWGRRGTNREDLEEALVNGKSAAFWDWCGRVTSEFRETSKS